MARTPGAKNRDHEATKQAIAARVLGAVVDHGAQPSLHEMARAAGASIPTLKHYFGGRSGVAAAALRSVREAAAPHTEGIANPGKLTLTASLTRVADDLIAAWVPHGVGRVFAAGLAAGMHDPEAGPGYLDGVLEPTIMALEARLKLHAERGETCFGTADELEVRVAALAFLSPLLVALIHQHALSGTSCRPLDMAAFSKIHVDRFVSAYGRLKTPLKK